MREKIVGFWRRVMGRFSRFGIWFSDSMKTLWEQLTRQFMSFWSGIWNEIINQPWWVIFIAIFVYWFISMLLETYRADNLGFSGKTLWDWFDLLIIPIVLAAVGFILSQVQKRYEIENTRKENETDRELAKEARDTDREIARGGKNKIHWNHTSPTYQDCYLSMIYATQKKAQKRA